MKQLKKELLAVRIEYHWWHIQREKRLGKRLLQAGRGLASKELIAVNNRFSKHCASVMRMQKEYEKLMKSNS